MRGISICSISRRHRALRRRKCRASSWSTRWLASTRGCARAPEAAGTLGSVAVMGLLAGAVWQATRGQVLPAATTLVWYALALAPPRARQLLESGEEKRSAREREGQLAEVD